MSEEVVPISAQSFEVLSTVARLSARTTNLYDLLTATLHTYLDQLPLVGAVVWLRDNEHDMLAPVLARLPANCAASAIAEDDALMQELLETDSLLLASAEAQTLLTLPDTLLLALVPLQHADVLLGLLGYVADEETLESVYPVQESSAHVLSVAVASAWLRRQQVEADEVSATLFKFAEELRAQRSLTDILATLNNLALRVFNCDWSAVYHWDNDVFCPVQIMTRIGEQPLDGEPLLELAANPVLEMLLSDHQILSVRDLREQPGAVPIYLARHDLRGLVLVPLQRGAGEPLGLLALGYRAPLTSFRSHAMALAQGVARMVAVALERTRERERGEEN